MAEGGREGSGSSQSFPLRGLAVKVARATRPQPAGPPEGSLSPRNANRVPLPSGYTKDGGLTPGSPPIERKSMQ